MGRVFEYDPEDIRRALLRVAGEAAAYLRGLACSGEDLARPIRGETVLVDVMAEEFIIGALRAELGRIRVVSEERGSEGSGDLTIIIDPLDGSRNYLNCIPWASVSLAAAPTGSSLRGVIAGVVAPIFYGHPLSFARGKGCFEGMSSITPRSPPSRFLMVYIDHPEAAESVAKVVSSLGGGYKIRSLGSAALEVAYTGIGRAAMFVDLRSKLRNVDLAAAAGIVRECGGEVLSPSGEPIDTGLSDVERAGNVIAVPEPSMWEAVGSVLSAKP